MSIKHPKYPLLFLFFILLSSSAIQAQIQIASPYSRFGIGDLSDNNNAWNSSMGETGIGLRSNSHVNFSNPASYTAFDSTSFLFEGGAMATRVTLTSNLQSASRNYATLGYMAFGMPVTKWWRTSIGLLPFSDVGYNVSNIDDVSGIGRITRYYTGSGGINRLYWGNGIKIFKSLSIGLNASYLFGSMQREAKAIFPDSAFFINMKTDNYITVSSLYMTYGVQYQFKIKKDIHMTAGAVFSPKTAINAKTDMIAQTFFLGSAGTEFPQDTVIQTDGYKGTIIIPAMFGLGLSCENPDKWLVGADFKWQNWKKFKAFGVSDSLVNSFQINAGAELIPNINSYSNYLKRIRYRLGFFYNSTYLDIRGKHLNEYAFSLGFGLPLRGVKTMLNIGAQVGTRGTTEANLIKETYFKVIIGFSIYERWFVKRKYY
jgi:hypothetical protein